MFTTITYNQKDVVMINRKRLIVLLFCVIMLIPSRVISGQIVQSGDQIQSDVTITYLQNDGVLISDGTKKVLIDAVFNPASSWINLNSIENNKLTNAQAPYDNVDLVLITHNHGDHYSVSNVNTHIANNSNGKVIAPPQVMANFSGTQFLDVTPSPGESDTLTVHGIELEVLHLKHFNAFGNNFDAVENFGYLIKIGGKNILHLGDVKMTKENLQNFGLADKNVDVVLIPTFYPEAHLMTSHRDALLSQVNPAHIIALHLLAGSIPAIVQQVNVLYPDATIFTTPLETYTLNTTSVVGEKQTPDNFNLAQNYPNPFNPSTTISYSVPQTTFVSIVIYNILGQKIRTLVNEEKPAGNYEVDFSAKGGSASGGNAYNLLSGIYYYSMTVDEFSKTKKMILLK